MAISDFVKRNYWYFTALIIVLAILCFFIVQNKKTMNFLIIDLVIALILLNILPFVRKKWKR